ncbi:MAG: PhoH family protein [Burkholderiales bacterium]|nr:PhoH family protein [Burkholderiales bacterium]
MQLRHSLSPADNSRLAHLCGPLDEHLRTIEAAFHVTVHRRGERFRIEGARGVPQQVADLLDTLYARSDRPLSAEVVQLAVVSAQRDAAGSGVSGAASPARRRTARGEAAALALDEDEAAAAQGPTLHTRRADLQGRTPNQVQYLQQILGNDLTLGIGPAGTGKTFLAVACAVDALERSTVQRIILTRPAVEAGERLGFLPGDLTQKVDPYLRPLYDALYDLMGFDRVTKAFEKGLIEIAPLAFMRGRTLNHAFIILDEAQNTTPEQMKMFLTRIGFGSRAVVTGDVSQIDLPRGSKSGLIEAERILKRVKGVAFTRFTTTDVVRHPLVARIVAAYDADQASEPTHPQAPQPAPHAARKKSA